MARAVVLAAAFFSVIASVSNNSTSPGIDDVAPTHNDEQSDDMIFSGSEQQYNFTMQRLIDSECLKQTHYLDESHKAKEIIIKIGMNENCPGKVVEREVKGIRGHHMVVVFTRFVADSRHILVGDGISLVSMSKYKCSKDACPPIAISSSNRVIVQAHPITGDQTINVDIAAFVIATSPKVTLYSESGESSGPFTVLAVFVAVLLLIILLLCCCILSMKSPSSKQRWTAADVNVRPSSANSTENGSLNASSSPSEQRRTRTIGNHKYSSEPNCSLAGGAKDAV